MCNVEGGDDSLIQATRMAYGNSLKKRAMRNKVG